MKTIKLITVGLLLLLLFIVIGAEAQISVQVNISEPPQWGPIGYSDVQYYYLPDVEAYYDVPSSMFIYFNGATWIHRRSLPGRYRNYDLYRGYKVVMSDYHGKTPYDHFKEHKTKYAKGYRGQPQKTYGKRPGNWNSYKKSSKGFKEGGKQGYSKSKKSNKGNGKKK